MTHDVVADIEVTPLALPLRRPIASALGSYTHVDCTVVRISTEDGLVGTGFNAGLGGAARTAIAPYISAELAPLLVGRPAAEPTTRWREMWAPNKPRLRGGLGAWALSAVDIALWDIEAKRADTSLHRLLGGTAADVAVYGSGGWHTLTDAELLDEATGFAALGITAYKFKTGTDRDAARTRLLRNELGDDFTLLADANQRFTVDEALGHASMLADFGVAWLEEPVVADAISDFASVAQHSAVPLAAGENAYYRWGFEELIAAGAAYLQPDVARVGGVSEFVEVAALAEEAEVPIASHLWHELSISVVGATSAGLMCEYAELIPGDALTRAFPVVDGAITVPDVPGHGVEFTDDALRNYATG